jgi:ATP-dependent Clp protease ATP-binding subunit ClpB
MNQNFTDSVSTALQNAFAQAQEEKKTEVTDNQLLLSFLEDKKGYFSEILSNLNTQPSTLIQKLQQDVNRQPSFSGSTLEAPSAARSLQSRIADAQSIAKKWDDS